MRQYNNSKVSKQEICEPAANRGEDLCGESTKCDHKECFTQKTGVAFDFVGLCIGFSNAMTVVKSSTRRR